MGNFLLLENENLTIPRFLGFSEYGESSSFRIFLAVSRGVGQSPPTGKVRIHLLSEGIYIFKNCVKIDSDL